MSIKSGYKPKEEQKPVESIKIETGTRRGTVKYIVNGKTVDNVLVKPIPQTTGVRKEDLDSEYAPKNHKHKEYLKPEEVDIHGEGQDGELLLHEETQAVQNNGTFTLEMKKDEQYERIITLPFTGLQHLAFADQLNYYNDVYEHEDPLDPQSPLVLTHQAEVSSTFKAGMKEDFVTTTGNSTISDGSLTIENSILTIDNEDADSIHSAIYIKGNDLYLRPSDWVPDSSDPNRVRYGGNIDCYDIDATDIKANGITIRDYQHSVNAALNGSGDLEITDGSLRVTGHYDSVLQSYIGGTIYTRDMGVTGEIYSNGTLYLQYSTGSYVECGNSTNSCNLIVHGDITATGTITPGSSDKRLKNVVDTINIPIEDLANAPLVQFKWNEKKQTKDTSTHGGTLAQYWQQIAPWAVGKDINKYLTLEYGPLALAAAVECAREIVKLKERIKELEERQ